MPLLKVAAVMGRRIDQALLRAVAPDADIDGWLLACGESSVLEVANDQWRFSHDKLRETLLNDLDADERLLLHTRAAEAIEALYPDQPDWYGVLLNHWRLARNACKESWYARMMAEGLLRRGELRSALSLAKRAGALARLCAHDAQAVPLNLLLGEIHFQLGEYVAAVKHYDHAKLDSLHSNTPVHNRLRADLGLCAVALRMGNWASARRYAERSLEMARAEQDRPAEALALRRLANAVKEQGQLDQAEAYNQQSLALYTALGDLAGQRIIYNNLGLLALKMGFTDRAQDYLMMCLANSERCGDRMTLCTVKANIARLAAVLNQLDAAVEQAEGALLLALELGAPNQMLYALSIYAQVMRQGGQHEQSARLIGLVLNHPKLQGETAADIYREDLPALRQAMSPEALAQAMEVGRALDLEVAVLLLLAREPIG
jgi:tetratricopeptide (TPR) repeat protein